MLTLSIDTSNKTMAIAVVDDQFLLGSIATTVKKNHSELLMISIENLMRSIDKVPSDLDRIVVAAGPGSYTGLRIGVTVAKTLAWTLSIPLVGVSSLESLAFNLDNNITSSTLIVPLFNARRQNVYTGIYRWNQDVFLCLKQDQHIGIKGLLGQLQEMRNSIIFIGEDVALFKDEICSVLSSATIINDDRLNQPSGLSLSLIGDRKLPVDDIYHFIPNYLKRVEAEEQWLDKTDQREDGWQNHLVSFEGF